MVAPCGRMHLTMVAPHGWMHLDNEFTVNGRDLVNEL